MEEERPSKRLKPERPEVSETQTGLAEENPLKQRSKKQKRKWQEEKSKKSQSKRTNPRNTFTELYSKNLDTGKNAQHGRSTGRTFSQPSVVQAGDKGIFVTCDKGREKKCLLELLDLVQQLAEGDSLQHTTGHATTAGLNPDLTNDGAEELDIEANIMAELATLQPPTPPDTSQSRPGNAVDLITLDVPCVSFLRFPRQSNIDPVELVHRICSDAARNPATPKSRYVKRLTPISKIGKVLSQGLESVCEDVLPKTFGIEKSVVDTGLKFAIRPSIRNNNKLDRDQVIKIVGDCVHRLGHGKHNVDLKGYEAGILVEVYRSWVGICVVSNENAGNITSNSNEMGYEQLKRFNLAEIYAAGRQKEGAE